MSDLPIPDAGLSDAQPKKKPGCPSQPRSPELHAPVARGSLRQPGYQTPDLRPAGFRSIGFASPPLDGFAFVGARSLLSLIWSMPRLGMVGCWYFCGVLRETTKGVGRWQLPGGFSSGRRR